MTSLPHSLRIAHHCVPQSYLYCTSREVLCYSAAGVVPDDLSTLLTYWSRPLRALPSCVFHVTQRPLPFGSWACWPPPKRRFPTAHQKGVPTAQQLPCMISSLQLMAWRRCLKPARGWWGRAVGLAWGTGALGTSWQHWGSTVKYRNGGWRELMESEDSLEGLGYPGIKTAVWGWDLGKEWS